LQRFSQRNGYEKEIELETATNNLKNKIYSVFYKNEYDLYDTLEYSHYTTGIEELMIAMGITYEFPENNIIKEKNAKKLESYIIENSNWYTIYDFIEEYLKYLSNDKKKQLYITKTFNEILENECAQYRIVDEKVIPIINKMEIKAIKEASKTKYESVNVHIKKALTLFSNRKNHDYENSIKESISAVESLCCIITGEKNATLGKALKELDSKGIYIHKSMQEAYSKLYGYTSDEKGIRHGGIDFTNAPIEDAKYMLISCSSFVNYLIEKLSKIEKS
jgi:hypothetical protein